MAEQRESSVEESEWAGMSERESGDDDMDFEVWILSYVVVFGWGCGMGDGR